MDAKKIETVGQNTELDEKSILDLWEKAKNTGKSITVDKGDEFDKAVYMDIEEASIVLKLSVYRIRQMYWEGNFGEAQKGVKKVYLLRSAVLAVKKSREQSKVKNTVVDHRRTGKRIESGSGVVIFMLEHDSTVETGLKNKMMEVLLKYHRMGQRLVESIKKVQK